MESLRVGIIGTGRPYKTPGATGFGMAHSLIKGYKQADNVKLVAVADIVQENGEKFVAEHEPSAKVYTDYEQMLAEEKPDVVSICTWPHLHAQMVIAAAQAGVRAIHCEKPMAITWGDARRMNQACVERGVQLSFNHQRRFNTPFRNARELIREGAIGKLLRLESQCPNLYDWGTHWFDMLFFLNDETPGEWVIGQIETRGDNQIFSGSHGRAGPFAFQIQKRCPRIDDHRTSGRLGRTNSRRRQRGRDRDSTEGTERRSAAAPMGEGAKRVAGGEDHRQHSRQRCVCAGNFGCRRCAAKRARAGTIRAKGDSIDRVDLRDI